MGIETMDVKAFLNTLFMADNQGEQSLVTLTGGRIYPDKLPQDTDFPAVLYHFHAGQDRLGGFGQLMFTMPIFVIEAISEGDSLVSVAQIMARFDSLLTGARQLSGPFVLGVTPVQPVDYPEIKSGKCYNHLGRQYRFFVYESPNPAD